MVSGLFVRNLVVSISCHDVLISFFWVLASFGLWHPLALGPRVGPGTEELEEFLSFVKGYESIQDGFLVLRRPGVLPCLPKCFTFALVFFFELILSLALL